MEDCCENLGGFTCEPWKVQMRTLEGSRVNLVEIENQLFEILEETSQYSTSNGWNVGEEIV